jgi:hypothetical protein
MTKITGTFFSKPSLKMGLGEVSYASWMILFGLVGSCLDDKQNDWC